MLEASVLVLNRSYLPIHVTSVRRAFVLLYRGMARAVDAEYDTFDFESWRARTPEPGKAVAGLVGGVIQVPRVILLAAFDRMPRRHVRFSRANIYSRDRNTCQYCIQKLGRADLNLDHVIPRSQGGRTTWENVVCSCLDCNRIKGGRTPRQAGMRLKRRPQRPRWTPMAGFVGWGQTYPEWGPFLSIINASNGNAELAQH
ncbi:MAG: HNH endonuclease [bacterium]|nr:HNH endonuclease [bacterium]